MTAMQSSVLKNKSQNHNSEVYVATLDVGTSSVRSLLFNQRAEEMEGFGIQIPYEVKTTSDGGVEVGADQLAELVVKSLSVLHQQIQEQRLKVSAVACCTFWHNVLGWMRKARPRRPFFILLTLALTRRRASWPRGLTGAPNMGEPVACFIPVTCQPSCCGLQK